MLDTPISSSDYTLSYQVLTNGEVTAEGTISNYAQIAPQSTATLTLPSIVVGTGNQVYLDLTFTYAKDTLYSKKGDLFIHEQFQLSSGNPQVPTIDNSSSLSINGSISSYYEIKGTNPRTSKSFVVRINKTSGVLCYYESGGVVLINGNIQPNFWRV
jgi:hypothetical protein